MEIAQHIDVEAPAESVWAVIGPEFSEIGTWASAIPHSEPTADGHGRVCTVKGAPGLSRVVEQVVAYDADARTLTYLARDMPGFVTAARNSWQVEPLGSMRTRASFIAEVEVAGPARLMTPLLALGLRGLGRRTLRELRHVVEQGRPTPRKQRQLDRTRSAGRSGAVSSSGVVGQPPTTPSGDGGRLLAAAVSGNAFFSAITGMVLLAGGFALDTWLGVDAWLLVGVGGGLVLFADLLLWLLTRPRRLMGGARAVVVADAVWVAGAAVLLARWPSALSSAGRTALVLVTGVVATIGMAQVVGLRRAGSEHLTGTSPIDVVARMRR